MLQALPGAAAVGMGLSLVLWGSAVAMQLLLCSGSSRLCPRRAAALCSLGVGWLVWVFRAAVTQGEQQFQALAMNFSDSHLSQQSDKTSSW